MIGDEYSRKKDSRDPCSIYNHDLVAKPLIPISVDQNHCGISWAVNVLPNPQRIIPAQGRKASSYLCVSKSVIRPDLAGMQAP